MASPFSLPKKKGKVGQDEYKKLLERETKRYGGDRDKAVRAANVAGGYGNSTAQQKFTDKKAAPRKSATPDKAPVPSPKPLILPDTAPIPTPAPGQQLPHPDNFAAGIPQSLFPEMGPIPEPAPPQLPPTAPIPMLRPQSPFPNTMQPPPPRPRRNFRLLG